jgi:CheY-like chemotaxis protein
MAGASEPFLQSSGFGRDEDRARGREAGFADHLVKPVDLQQFQRAIGRVVQERAS